MFALSCGERHLTLGVLTPLGSELKTLPRPSQKLRAGTMEKLKQYKLIIGIVLVVLVGAFYWFEWRPSQAKKDCYREIYNSSLDLSAFGDDAVAAQFKENEFKYKNCLKGRGF